MWMPQQLHYLYFSEDLSQIFIVKLCFVYDFNSNLKKQKRMMSKIIVQIYKKNPPRTKCPPETKCQRNEHNLEILTLGHYCQGHDAFKVLYNIISKNKKTACH